jgi:cellulose synthase/poly-beta-1,6-N-acetylglucosamine synthase-like glycosyltransferase
MNFEVVEYLLLAVALAVSVALWILSLECLASLWPVSAHAAPASTPSGAGPRICVMIPAHDEAAGIAASIDSIRSGLSELDRVWVVADNCSDATASIAQAHHAQVIERHDLERLGKSFALEFGVRQLASDPPEVLILMDADTRALPGSLKRLAELAIESGQPVQAANLMTTTDQASPRELISQSAVIIKNFVRLLGVSRLGLGCPLTGSGIALPWSVAKKVEFASGSIVEDMQLGLELQLAGFCPSFCPQARVESRLPQQTAAAAAQRRRWEHGHLQVIVSQVPRLVWGAVRQCRIDLLWTALETAIPPLSLLALLWTATFAASLLAGGLTGYWPPSVLLGVSGAIATASLLTAWLRFSSRKTVWKSVCAAPHYVVRKIPLYASFLFARQKTWTRTAREPLSEIQSQSLRMDS